MTYENNVLTSGCITMEEYKVTVEDGEVTTTEKGICELPKIITIVEQAEEGKIQTGDELAIKSEHFYVVSSNENETVMLAKYNLLVGNITTYNPSPTLTSIEETVSGYGFQNEKALGDIRDTSKEYIGTLKYDSTFYWDAESQVGGGLVYPGSYDESNYPYVYDQNSDLYNYVEDYRDELEKIGASISEARLLTYQEAINILGDEYKGDSYECNTYSDDKNFIFLTSYWLGTAGTETSIHYIGTCGRFSMTGALYPYGNGVRPVIVVNTSDIDL